MTAPHDFHIDHLADHPEAIPVLARWFQATWPDHYDHSIGDVEREFQTASSRDELPIALAAFAGSDLVGTIAVRARALDSQPESPGLGGLYVLPAFRGRGIGAALVEAGTAEARRLGLATVYTGTSTAQRLFVRLGWRELRTVRHGGEDVTLFRIGT